MTDSFGARLRRERERRSIEIADVAARTKIKASLFEALERNDVSQWPAGLFRRSFIRAYAETVGLDSQATLVEFMQNFPDPADSASERHASNRNAPERHASQRKGAEGAGSGNGGSGNGGFATDAGSNKDRTARFGRPVPLTSPPAAVAPIPDRIEFQPEPVRQGSTELAEALRLTLAEADMPFQVGRLITDRQAPWIAVACDMVVVFALALIIFAVADRFWMPLSITALAYFAGGILLLGNSPGICLLAPQDRADELRPSEPARSSRPRHVDPGRGRPAALPHNPFRAPRRARTNR